MLMVVMMMINVQYGTVILCFATWKFLFNAHAKLHDVSVEQKYLLALYEVHRRKYLISFIMTANL